MNRELLAMIAYDAYHDALGGEGYVPWSRTYEHEPWLQVVDAVVKAYLESEKHPEIDAQRIANPDEDTTIVES